MLHRAPKKAGARPNPKTSNTRNRGGDRFLWAAYLPSTDVLSRPGLGLEVVVEPEASGSTHPDFPKGGDPGLGHHGRGAIVH